MLTKEEAFRFIRDVVGIHEPEVEMKKCHFQFLKQIISSVQSIPFQNVTFMRNTTEERRRPSYEEVKASMLGGKGGLCYTMNLFTFHLLKHLGYNAYLNLSQCCGSILNHLFVLVYNVRKDGDIYLVDTGCGCPTFSPVDLEFEKESPVYHESYLRFKFVRKGNKIKRLHDRSVFEASTSKEPKEFALFYEFQIRPTTNLDDINICFDDVYKNPNSTPFHRSLRAIKFNNSMTILICDSLLVLESETGQLNITTFKTDEELEKAYNRYFPELDELDVKYAIHNWRRKFAKL